MYNPSRLFSSGRQAERRRLFRLVHGVPLQGTHYSRLWRRKKRFMILVSSFLGPCLPRIFGRSTSPVSTWNVLSLSLHEFLANARDRWKQLSQPGGGDNDCAKPACYYTFERFLDFGHLSRCFSRDGAKRTIDRGNRFRPDFSPPRVGSIFNRAKTRNGKGIFLTAFTFLV